jgi:hypothetical protein
MTQETIADHRFSLVEVQAAVRRFLTDALVDVHRIDVVRVAPSDRRGAAWEAIAVVSQPNAAIQNLGLETERLVLDQNRYVVRLDDRLEVIAYETGEEADNS